VPPPNQTALQVAEQKAKEAAAKTAETQKKIDDLKKK